MNIIKTSLLATLLVLGMSIIPTANAEVIVRYIVIEDGHSYHEPMSYRPGSRLYTRSYNDRYYASKHERRARRNHHEHYRARQYRNEYYSPYHRNEYRNRDRRCGGSGSVYRREVRRDHEYHRDAPHKHREPYEHQRKYQKSYNDKRVHISIK